MNRDGDEVLSIRQNVGTDLEPLCDVLNKHISWHPEYCGVAICLPDDGQDFVHWDVRELQILEVMDAIRKAAETFIEARGGLPNDLE